MKSSKDSNSNQWPELRQSLGVKGVTALKDIWYGGYPMTRDIASNLEATFKQYPLGQTNFKAWVKRTLRQLFENYTRRKV